MRLTDTGRSKQGDVLAGFQPFKALQFANHPGVNARLFGEIKIFQRLHRRKMRCHKRLLVTVDVPLFNLLAEDIVNYFPRRHLGFIGDIQHFRHVIPDKRQA